MHTHCVDQFIRWWFMVVLATLALALLTGCATTYSVAADPASGKITTLEIKSRREFENGLVVDYNKETGSFRFQAGSVTNGVSPLETAAAQLLLQLPALLAPVPPIP